MLPEVHFIPEYKSIQVKSGTTILDASNKVRVTIRTRCGGKAACLMCKVLVEDQSGISAPNLNEKLKLGDLIDSHYRLACQACVTGQVFVQVPEDPLKTAVRALLAKQQAGDDDL